MKRRNAPVFALVAPDGAVQVDRVRRLSFEALTALARELAQAIDFITADLGQPDTGYFPTSAEYADWQRRTQTALMYRRADQRVVEDEIARRREPVVAALATLDEADEREFDPARHAALVVPRDLLVHCAGLAPIARLLQQMGPAYAGDHALIAALDRILGAAAVRASLAPLEAA